MSTVYIIFVKLPSYHNHYVRLPNLAVPDRKLHLKFIMSMARGTNTHLKTTAL